MPLRAVRLGMLGLSGALSLAVVPGLHAQADTTRPRVPVTKERTKETAKPVTQAQPLPARTDTARQVMGAETPAQRARTTTTR